VLINTILIIIADVNNVTKPLVDSYAAEEYQLLIMAEYKKRIHC